MLNPISGGGGQKNQTIFLVLLIEAPAEPCRRSLGAFGDASQRIVEFCAALKFSDIAWTSD
jgi:hypothetical protein